MRFLSLIAQFFRTLHCAGCERRIFFWEARYFVEDAHDFFHGECACAFLESEVKRLLRRPA